MDKEIKYKELCQQLESVVLGETYWVSVLSTVSSMLKTSFERFSWVGFYLEHEGCLKVGPYQGSLGCLTIEFDRGICGRAFRLAETQVVDDVHADAEHIACDPASSSEIVIPVFDGRDVVGVMDVDSEHYAQFDETDRKYLERIVRSIVEPALQNRAKTAGQTG